MPAAPAISFSADAISSACARLSSAHGPAISASGSALPKRTLPIATTELGRTWSDHACPHAGGQLDRRRETAPGRCGGGNPGPLSFIGLQTRPTASTMANRVLRNLKVISENPLIRVRNLEKTVTSRRYVSSNTNVAPCAARGPTISRPICSVTCVPSVERAAAVSAAKRIAASRIPRVTSGGSAAKCCAERGRVHHLDFAARRLDRDAARGRFQVADCPRRP